MLIKPWQRKDHDLRWSSPPPRELKSEANPVPEDTVVLSPFQAADERIRPYRNKVLMTLGWGLMAAGRMISMVPGPAAPGIVCAGEMNQAGAGSRLEQVLQCALVDAPSQLNAGTDRASFAWEGLRAGMGGLEDLKERPGAGTITAWPYGQVMTAALDQAKLSGDYTDFDQLVKGLERYAHPGGGYSPSPGRFGFHGNRFMDDNAWLGLTFVQAAQQVPDAGYLEKAESVAEFLRSSQEADGGIVWEEGNANPSYNTATFGPSIELSLRLYKLTGDDKHLKFAHRLTDIMDDKLRRADGLYADNLDLKSGRIEPTLWSYNQGTPVGAHLLWYDITGDSTHLEKAQQTSHAALEHFGEEGIWKQPPAFNAIFFRNLLRLEDPLVEEAFDGYLSRAWSESLNPETGLFNRAGHGMGSYEGHGDVSTLDQAALIQLNALQSWPVEARSQIA
jgi:glycosyl hydrolase family 76